MQRAMSPEQIPFMQWGIAKVENYRGELELVPIKVHDPQISYPIIINGTNTGNMFGRSAYISLIRDSRPRGVDDEFGAIIRGEGNDNAYAIVVAADGKRLQHPYSLEPRIEDLTGNKAVAFINRFPSLVRCLDPEIEEHVRPTLDEYAKIARGINLVTTTTDYYDNISDMPHESLTNLLRSMIEAIKYCTEASIETGIEQIVITPVFNLGEKAGGSVKQIHSQVHMDMAQDGHGPVMETILKAANDSCRLCISNHGNRHVYENTTLKLWVARAPLRNYMLRFAPRRHVEGIESLYEEEISGMADIILKGSRGLDALGVERDRYISIHTRPVGYTSSYHLFCDMMPAEPVGGLEMSDAVRIVRTGPAGIADELRRAVDKF
jgi:UDPglucose--hexose-1-phosphate uridylyltransferase